MEYLRKTFDISRMVKWRESHKGEAQRGSI